MANERKTQKRHLKEDKHYEDRGLQDLLNTYHGRRLLWWVLAETGIFQNPFTTNALTTAHETGKMRIGQNLLVRIMDVNDDAYITMMRENKELQQKRREEIAEAKGTEDDEYLDDDS